MKWGKAYPGIRYLQWDLLLSDPSRPGFHMLLQSQPWNRRGLETLMSTTVAPWFTGSSNRQGIRQPIILCNR
ncbi:hypothetical protein ABBQ38_010990 [Trebouxia sp. C0009 RCD-2024]